MLSVLEPLEIRLASGASTANEHAFVAAYGAELSAGLEHCRAFALSGVDEQLQMGWEHFHGVLSHLSHELHETKALQLEQAPPLLH